MLKIEHMLVSYIQKHQKIYKKRLLRKESYKRNMKNEQNGEKNERISEKEFRK